MFFEDYFRVLILKLPPIFFNPCFVFQNLNFQTRWPRPAPKFNKSNNLFLLKTLLRFCYICNLKNERLVLYYTMPIEFTINIITNYLISGCSKCDTKIDDWLDWIMTTKLGVITTHRSLFTIENGKNWYINPH